VYRTFDEQIKQGKTKQEKQEKARTKKKEKKKMTMKMENRNYNNRTRDPCFSGQSRAGIRTEPWELA
jgi:hypothetical protein